MQPTSYAFGDTLAASRRLELLAEAFETPSRAFLAESAPAGARLAYDLGCGPGFTTALLQEVARPERSIGIDASERFVGEARERFPTLEFALHDVTRAPLPAGPAALMYCRMLLTHLPDPEAALQTWTGELAPGGRLLVDEVESIETSEPVFRDYLAAGDRMIAARGGRLYIGKELDRLALDGVAKSGGTGRRHSPPPQLAAMLFRLNLGVWGEAPDAPVTRAEQAALAEALDQVIARGGGEITWTMRQIAYEKR